MATGETDWAPPGPGQGELRERASEDEWRGAVLAIAARHGLGDQRTARLFDSGSDVVFGGADLVFKFTDPRWSEQMASERRWLEHLDGALSVATPQLVAEGEICGWPYTVMTRVAGTPLGTVWATLDHAARLVLAQDVGELVAELHVLPLPDVFEPWEPFAHTAVAAARTRRAQLIASDPDVTRALVDEVESFLAESLGAETSDGVERAAAAGFGDARRVVLHTELLDQHVLVDTSGARLRPCGLIDLADARVGPPEYDVPALVEFVLKDEPGALDALCDGLGGELAERDEAATDRLLAWSMCHRFAHLGRMVRAAGGARDLATLRARLFPPRGASAGR
ncbi:Phosphotransferase enzyme family protein [Planctomycetes bacterium Pla163]|uniref:Phosphotransferase enzyme family protein n=1 Tax=Rohdeia mirabilis TaxID=2528008 RepID=A0A518D0T9_9BACT|nr:Phosphotransferase enzyme family protein [Planctomycetes bacterium Pla163]